MGTTSTTKLRDVKNDRVTDTSWYDVTETARTRPVHQELVTVRCPMNGTGAITLESTDGSRTFQVVEHATPEIKTVLSRMEPGAEISVQLVRLIARGDLWRAVGVRPDPTPI